MKRKIVITKPKIKVSTNKSTFLNRNEDYELESRRHLLNISGFSEYNYLK